MALFLCLNFSLNAQADDAQTKDAKDVQIFIEDIATQAFEALSKSDLDYKRRQAEFRTLLGRNIDIDYVARFVLGPYSRKASEDQISTFSKTLEDYMVLTYAYRFQEFHVENLAVINVEEGKRNNMIVNSIVELPGEIPDISVAWLTHKLAGEWKIIDISIEGLSMVTIQREEYVAVIRQGGGKIDYLIDAMEKKNVKLAKRAEN